MINFIKVLLIHFTYVALMFLLVAAGFGVPIPEDVPLIFSGYLCQPHDSPLADNAPAKPGVKADTDPTRNVPDPWLMMIAGLTGVVGGDSVLWYIGNRGMNGNNWIARHVRKVMSSKRHEKVERYFKKHGNLTVFIGRFAPGLRAMVFAMAGVSGMSYKRFVLLDGSAALISVPAFIFIGYHFAANINEVFHALEKTKKFALYALIPIGLILVIWYIVRMRKRRPVDKSM